MSFEEDKEFLIIMGVLLAFILFCAIMAVQSSKKQKENKEKAQKDKERRINMSPHIVEIIFGGLWFLMAILIYIMFEMSSLGSFRVPKFMMFIYDLFGIQTASIIQALISLCLVGHGIYAIKEIRK